MKNKVFADSNIIIYSLGNDTFRKEIAKNIIRANPYISFQVLNEVANISFKKLSLSNEKTLKVLNFLAQKCRLHSVDFSTIQDALKIKSEYGYSYYDSLIISAALETGCEILYSEDLHDGQLVGNSLKIINPFK